MLKTLEVGKVYRLKKYDSEYTYIFIHECKTWGGGTVRINFNELGKDRIESDQYTDPGIWEEVNAKTTTSG